MVEKEKTYLVMGLLDPHSIAFAIGKTIQKMGGRVIYTAQNERMKRIFLDRSKELTEQEKKSLDVRFCDVTLVEEVKTLFSGLGSLAGIVHSIAYVNPKTGLGEEFHTDAVDDLKTGFHVSAISLATVVSEAQSSLAPGGSVVSLTFESTKAFPYYNWMGVNKAALEAVVRSLARRHGKDNIRVNAVSAGPLATKAATSIPGFGELGNTWEKTSPLGWDVEEDRYAVAETVAFLLGPYARKITGQTIYVDGGASIIGGILMPHEREKK